MSILKVLLGIVTIVLYIVFRVILLKETRIMYKGRYLVVGLGVFITILVTVWALNIAEYNTIIYYPIIELFK
jgi:hypothetical protein